MEQSLSNVLIHVVFSTKDRQHLIDKDIEPHLHSFMISLSASLGSFMHKIGGTEDHVHLFLTLPRVLAMSDLLEQVKKNSSRWIKTQGGKYSSFSWQKGYGVFSVSMSNYTSIADYIANQREHHKKYSFQDEFRKLLTLNNIPYDERYVWD